MGLLWRYIYLYINIIIKYNYIFSSYFIKKKKVFIKKVQYFVLLQAAFIYSLIHLFVVLQAVYTSCCSFPLLWLIGYIYITILKDLFMLWVSGIKCLPDKTGEPGLVNGCIYLGQKWEADCISIHMYYLIRFEVFCIRATLLLRIAFSVHLGMHFKKVCRKQTSAWIKKLKDFTRVDLNI